MTTELRTSLVETALNWQKLYGVAPAITSALSEYDAAVLVGCTISDYSRCMQGRTAVGRGYDFMHQGFRYQVKANRPSGNPGSLVTLVAKPKNYEWDYLVWILYDNQYVVKEAWQWEVSVYRQAFESTPRLSPLHMRAAGGISLRTQQLAQVV